MTQDQIMELVQVYASAWALVGSRFDNGNGMADALEAKAAVVAALEQLIKDVLEQAAQVCEKSAETIWDYHADNRKQIGTTVCNNLANAIRKMIGEI